MKIEHWMFRLHGQNDHSVFPGGNCMRSDEAEIRFEYAEFGTIGSVNQRYVDAVILRDDCGMTFREVGAILGPCGGQRAGALYRKGRRLLERYKRDALDLPALELQELYSLIRFPEYL